MTLRSLPPLQSLRVFECAARLLSFKLAAEELHVTPAAISHQIKGLEEHLGVPLFVRLTRALQLTDAGAAMLPHVQEGLRMLARGAEAAAGTPARTQLEVIVPPSFGTRWLMPRLQGFTRRYPDINLSLSTRLTSIDVSESPGARRDLDDLREGRTDAEIRFGNGRYPGMRADLIFEAEYVPVCNPALISSKRPLASPGDLRYHVLIHDDTIPELDERPQWSEWLRVAGVTDVDVSRGPHFSNSGLALDAAKDGLGLTLAFRPLVARDIAEGRLAVPFDIALHTRYAYYLVTPEVTGERPELSAFRTWLLEEAARPA